MSADVIADRLAFSQAPAVVVNGQVLTTHPEVEATDAAGTVDQDVTDLITITT